MKKEEEQTLTPAIIAARAKKGLAIATGNPLDKIVIAPPVIVKSELQSEQTLIERVVNIMQRRKRALQMKRSKPRIVRARNIKRNRLATREQLMRRAMRMAKTMLRKRAAGARGANYSNLSPGQKINIDRQVEPRTKNLKAMATRLMPRIRAGEMKRLNAVRGHKSTKGVYGNVQNLTQSNQPVFYSKLLGEMVTVEDLNLIFSMYEGRFLSAVTAPIRGVANVAKAAGTTALAVQSDKSLAAATGALAAYGINKLSNFGKYDPEKDKKDKDDKHADKMKTSQQKLAQQALIQSKQKTKQAQLTTKQMQAKMVSNKPTGSLSNFIRSNSQQTQSNRASAPVTQSSTTPTPTPTSNTTVAQANTTTSTSPAVSSNRLNKQAAAAKAARQQMGLVNHKEWDYESYLQEKAEQHLQKKADKYGASLEEVTDVFEQGLADYVQNNKTTPHQFAMQRVNSYLTTEGDGLWDNIHAKRKRIKSGSGERMRKPGSEGAPTKQNFVDAAEGIGAGFEGTKKLTNKYKKVTPC